MFIRKYLAIALALILMLFGCSASEEKEQKEEPKSEETVSENNDDNGKEHSNAFDGDLIDCEIGDYNIKVPANWIGDKEYFYPESGDADDFAMLYLSKSAEKGMSGAELLVSSKEFLEGVAKAFENYEISDVGITDVNGLTVLKSSISGTLSGRNGITYINWFLNPSDGAVNAVMFFQGNDSKYNYEDDVEKIVNSLSLRENAEMKNEENSEETSASDDNTQENATQEDVPREYISALKSAESYSNLMHMSKKGIYDQLTSEYGEKFEPEAAQYAIDNIKADWKQNALKSAESYAKNMHMSKKGVYDQLISEYGEQFELEEAQYAIDNIEVDWNYNALQTAKSYQENMNMSSAAIYDQLVSEYGEKFEPSEAQYAVDHLND